MSSRGAIDRVNFSEQPSPEFIVYEAGIVRRYLNVSPQSAASILTSAGAACHMGWGGSRMRLPQCCENTGLKKWGRVCYKLTVGRRIEWSMLK